MMSQITLYSPALEELSFRRALLSDPDTMAYNHAYGGTIDFPPERWADWHRRWVEDPEGRFYRYLRSAEGFVGEAAYHFDGELGGFLCDVIVHASHRGRGYGGQGLELLCQAAGENGVERLYDDIALDNPSVGLFLRHGFREVKRTEAYVLVARDL